MYDSMLTPRGVDTDSSRLAVVLFLLGSLWSEDASCGGGDVTPSPVIEHELTVAANPTLYLTNAEVDGILSQVNALMHSKKYSWDVSCPDVLFVRKGDVIADAGLLLIGTYEQLATNLRQIAPQATTLVVSSINCEGIQAAGCGPVGMEPMVVGQYPGYENQLWSHERGHNVGLPHSAEFPATETSVQESVAFRFMFWRLGIGHVGKTSLECNQFEASSLPSVEHHAASLAPATAMRSMGQQEREDVAGPPSAANAEQDNEREVASTAKAAGLTVAAFKVIGPPWVEHIPFDDIKALRGEDLDSIRSMLKGQPNEYWPQGLSALALAGTSHDVMLLKNALELPMPAVAPGAALDQAQIDQLRLLMRIKLAAPGALGILANRTESTAAVETLKNSSRLDVAATLIGSGAATSLSKSALDALVISNSASARSFVDQVIKSSAERTSGSGGLKVAPITSEEARKLKANQEAIRRKGLEAYMKSGGSG